MNILVSACLLGVSCRYDGTGCLLPELEELKKKHHNIQKQPQGKSLYIVQSHQNERSLDCTQNHLDEPLCKDFSSSQDDYVHNVPFSQ